MILLNQMKKFLPYILILIVTIGLFSPGIQIKAVTCPAPNTPAGCTPAPTPSSNYNLLAPLPCTSTGPSDTSCVNGKLTNFDPTQASNLGVYLNLMITLFIGICAVLAVIMIVMGGIEYMTSELISNKEEGKKRITNAIFGLLLALGAWTLLNTINPDLLKTELSSLVNVTVNVTLEEQIKGRLGQGKCEPITSGICSPASLATAGFIPEPPRATQASSICRGESGGNPSLASEIDICSDNNPFSFGLFQINVIAHANTIPGNVCSNVFQVNGGGPQGTCLERPADGICRKWDCSVKDQAKYNSCVSFITNPTNNIAYALGLQGSSGWGQWGFNASCRF